MAADRSSEIANRKKREPSILALIAKHASLAFTAVPATAVLLSIIFYISYFSFFGIEILYFFSIQDLITNALFWLVPTFVYFAVLILEDKFNSLLFSNQQARVFSIKGRVRDTFLLIIAAVPIIVSILVAPIYLRTTIVLSSTIVLIELVLIKFPTRGRSTEYRVRRSLAISTIIVTGLVITFGMGKAAIDSQFGSNLYRVILSEDKKEQDIILLANVQKGIIYLNEKGTIVILEHSKVERIERSFRKPSSHGGLVCLVLGQLCGIRLIVP